MTAVPVLQAMSTCLDTGLSIPECSCRACHRRQLRRYAPHLDPRSAPALNFAASIIPLQLYAHQLGISPEQLRREAAKREVIV